MINIKQQVDFPIRIEDKIFSRGHFIQISIQDGYHIYVYRFEFQFPHSINISHPVIDFIKCPQCGETVSIIHDLKDIKPLPNRLPCLNCNRNIFSQLLIASKMQKFVKFGGY